MRVPNDIGTTALFAQNLSRDLVRIGEPQVISSADARGPVGLLWLGDHFLVALAHDGLRATRVSAEGRPLDGDLPSYVTELYADFKLANVGGRTIVARHSGVTELDDTVAALSASAPLEGVTQLGEIVTTRDGRTWLLYTTVETAAEGYQLSRPFAREITFE